MRNTAIPGPWMSRSGLVAALILVALGALAGSAAGQALSIGQRAPELAGAPWINSAPLTTAALQGRVLLVDFWTYG